VIPGETLLFIDEIQVSQEAIMSLRYFKEDYPELHVIAAGSLLEFTLEELPSFGGGIVAIVPKKMAICVYSPELNNQGNSLIGTIALELFTTKTGLSIF
jgi:hypothetical protein